MQPNGMAYENGAVVQTVAPVYPEDQDSTNDEISCRENEQVATLLAGLSIVLRDGPKESAIVRIGALMVLLGEFPSPAEAAREIGVHRSTVCRAVERLRRKLAASLRRNTPSDKKPNEDRALHAP